MILIGDVVDMNQNIKLLDKVLNQLKEDRKMYLPEELDNIVFLDFDGVLNLDIVNYTGNANSRIPMKNLNKICLDYNFSIVVISSWRSSLNYRELLYESGLDSRIKILGATEVLGKSKEIEIIEYLENHNNINKFIVLDDGDFDELEPYQIQPVFSKGFDDKKYIEAVELIESYKNI